MQFKIKTILYSNKIRILFFYNNILKKYLIIHVTYVHEYDNITIAYKYVW